MADAAAGRASPIETDALVIGAGPVGLFQVFELGLQALHAEVVDVLPAAGGQCTALYPDKPIYDIPSVVRCTGRELVDNLLRQIAPMRAGFHFGQLVDALQPRSDGRFDVSTSKGCRFVARTVFIAAGVGAFQPRGLKLPGIEVFAGKQLFGSLEDAEAGAWEQLVVVGGDEAAVDAAIVLAARASTAGRPAPILLHRRDVLQAADDRLQVFESLRQQRRLVFEVGQPVAFDTQASRLSALEVVRSDGSSTRIAADALLTMTGLSPKLGPVADWQLAMQKKQLAVDPATLQTSLAGVYAVGDINTYPGKRKLIVSGFHEATLAAFAAAAHLAPGERIALEYTTASPRLHALLGVA